MRRDVHFANDETNVFWVATFSVSHAEERRLILSSCRVGVIPESDVLGQKDAVLLAHGKFLTQPKR